MIEVCTGDITRLDVEAIVNAANPSLLGGGGVDGAIHLAAGPQLREFNSGLGGCPTGEARISPGFRLRAQYVISTVGPVWHGGDQGEPELLKNAYRHSLELALDNSVRSIAFPAISTGVYGYPLIPATEIAISVMRCFESRFDLILACCFSQSVADVYEDALERIVGCSG
jgi:O-acetyl-ADP-ribose deacetylase (regulator of RNase III)